MSQRVLPSSASAPDTAPDTAPGSGPKRAAGVTERSLPGLRQRVVPCKRRADTAS
ncbi:hypothetical protein [Streptomyces aureocirculatus]|uniref:hypothetical protein n=1 Tax=Streptomyces aureocirculatus TaxID=67275 RepID=UPI000A6E92E1|nr:hypothetical protein [Streptomyces aureocirculatus]